MAEYGREQRNQLSRAIANNEEVCRQLKGFVDNRFNNELTLLQNSLYFHKQPCGKAVQRVENNNISPDSVNDILKDISKEELLAMIKFRVVEAGNELLAQINQTTDDCPYIRKWFTYYGEKDILSITQAISRFAPLSNNASSLDEYVDFVIGRVRMGLQKHINTGTVEDIPYEIMDENRKPTDFVHIAQRKTGVFQMAMCRCKRGTTTDIESSSVSTLREPYKSESMSSAFYPSSANSEKVKLIDSEVQDVAFQFDFHGLLDENQIPKMALKYAFNQLKEAIEGAGLAESEIDKEKVKADIIKKIDSQYGALKGPVQNVKNILDSYIEKAVKNRYNLANENVLSEFVGFLFALETEGYQDKDTTGTQIGNYKGSWRGGGFS